MFCLDGHSISKVSAEVDGSKLPKADLGPDQNVAGSDEEVVSYVEVGGLR